MSACHAQILKDLPSPCYHACVWVPTNRTRQPVGDLSTSTSRFQNIKLSNQNMNKELRPVHHFFAGSQQFAVLLSQSPVTNFNSLQLQQHRRFLRFFASLASCMPGKLDMLFHRRPHDSTHLPYPKSNHRIDNKEPHELESVPPDALAETALGTC